jgi:excinuclease UvrABC ATPase subunit
MKESFRDKVRRRLDRFIERITCDRCLGLRLGPRHFFVCVAE